MEYEAMRIACSPEIGEACSASAVIARNFLRRHVARMFMWYHRHPCPTRVFEDEASALTGLRRAAERKPG